jgi:uncharacterized membrane protein
MTLVFVVLVAVASHLAPYVARRDVFFGVTVSDGFPDGPVGRSVSRWYAAEIWLLAAAAGVLAMLPMAQVSGPTLLAQSFGASVAFLNARRKVQPYAAAPATVREAAIGPRPSLPGGWLAQLGPFLILLAAAAYVGLHWHEIPARFPTHWNLAGRADGWTTRSVPGVFRSMAIGLAGCAMTLFTSYAVLRWTRLPRVSGIAGEQSRRVRDANLIAMLASEYLLAALLAWTSIVAMFSDQAAHLRLPLALRAAPFAVLIVGSLAIHMIRRAPAFGGAPIGDATPDSRWLLGRIYINRADPVLFVEKRMGVGYTLNFGNPVAWLVVVVAITFLSILLVMG